MLSGIDKSVCGLGNNAVCDNIKGLMNFDVLLPRPKGLMITVKCSPTDCVGTIKDLVWGKIQGYAELGDKSKFLFEGISQLATLDKLEDDAAQVKDISLYCNLLKLVERRDADDVDEKLYKAKLSMLVGKNVIMDNNKINCDELKDYQELINHASQQYNSSRENMGSLRKLLIRFPIRVKKLYLEKGATMNHMEEFNTMQYNFWIDSCYRVNAASSDEIITSFYAPFACKVKTLISTLVDIYRLNTGFTYLFKVSGYEDYFFDDDIPIPSYLYIQECIRDNDVPNLVLTSYEQEFKVSNIDKSDLTCDTEDFTRFLTTTPLHYSDPGSSLRVCDAPGKFSITINSIDGLTTDRNSTISVYVGMYYGTQRLEQVHTTQKPFTSVVEWNEKLQFDVKTQNIPRAGKICICVQRNNDETQYWLNLSVFNHKGFLRQGNVTQHLWPENQRRSFNYTGGLCPYDLNDTPILSIEFPQFDEPIRYVQLTEAKECAILMEGEGSLREAEAQNFSDKDSDEIRAVLEQSFKMNTIGEEMKAKVWAYRVHCCRYYPQGLPVLLECMNWDKFKNSCQLYTLLLDWKEIPVHTALQLLHLENADPHVRSFAVHSLDKILSDEKLLLYLLQLVEVLKHDIHIDSTLSRFLLKRALNNQIIGHYFYWHIKSHVESKQPAAKQFRTQYGMLLELYVRCCGDHMTELNAMSDALLKITTAYNKCKDKDPDAAKEEIRQQIQQPSVRRSLSHFICLSHPRIRVRDVNSERCVVFKSKKRPVLLFFKNDDITCKNDFSLMYKDGDDLRQDQLVSQMIQLMNAIWLEEGIDLKITAYNIICTGHKTGVIHGIMNAQTMSYLIKNYKKFRAFQLWLNDKNPQKKDFEEVRHNFIQSCCGYTLIHYVLGIADRHPSNIMLKDNGRMIHIDYGHILGHTKTFGGINREPSPFIFNKEFVSFIADGEDGIRSEGFKRFEQLFTRAYLVLRKHTQEFVILFHLMLTAGLTELATPSHIDYFTKAMCVDKSDDEAETRILKLLHDSINATRMIQVHWFLHILRNN